MIPETPVYGAQRRNISPPSEWIVGYPDTGRKRRSRTNTNDGGWAETRLGLTFRSVSPPTAGRAR